MIELQLERDRAPLHARRATSAGFSARHRAQSLRAGALLPSVRQLAQADELSTFTVTEAYDVLFRWGLSSRGAARGTGWRRARRSSASAPMAWQPPSLTATWLLSDVFADHSVPIKAGGGWLPNEWVNESGLQHALRAMSRVPAARMGDYGHPYGFAPLRERIAEQLDRHGLPVTASNVLLTQGATQGLDLIVRTLLRPGDTVIVEDPGYCNLLQILQAGGAGGARRAAHAGRRR